MCVVANFIGTRTRGKDLFKFQNVGEVRRYFVWGTPKMNFGATRVKASFISFKNEINDTLTLCFGNLPRDGLYNKYFKIFSHSSLILMSNTVYTVKSKTV